MQPMGFYWLVSQYGVNNYCVLCRVKAKKENKNIQQRNVSGFITIPLDLAQQIFALARLEAY